MKKLIILISAILITSCNKEYKIIKTEVIKGKISAKEYGIGKLKSTALGTLNFG